MNLASIGSLETLTEQEKLALKKMVDRVLTHIPLRLGFLHNFHARKTAGHPPQVILVYIDRDGVFDFDFGFTLAEELNEINKAYGTDLEVHFSDRDDFDEGIFYIDGTVSLDAIEEFGVAFYFKKAFVEAEGTACL